LSEAWIKVEVVEKVEMVEVVEVVEVVEGEWGFST
jgi:hypothetical protein